jgi:hypothetical protein
MDVVGAEGGLTVVRVAQGTRAPLCVVDFTGFVDMTILSGLLARDSRDHSVVRLDPVRDFAEPREVSLPALAAGYAALLREHLAQPAAILSYRSMASLALHMATELDVPAILVEPTWPDDHSVCAEIRTIRPSLVPRATAAEAAGAGVKGIIKALGRDVADAMRESDAPDGAVIRELLVQRYAAWIRFLAVTAGSPVPPPTEDTYVVISNDSDCGPAPSWPEQAESSVVDVPYDELLDAPELVDVIWDLLAD